MNYYEYTKIFTRAFNTDAFEELWEASRGRIVPIPRIHGCIYIYIYIHTHTHTYIHKQTNKQTNKTKHMYKHYTQTYLHAHSTQMLLKSVGRPRVGG